MAVDDRGGGGGGKGAAHGGLKVLELGVEAVDPVDEHRGRFALVDGRIRGDQAAVAVQGGPRGGQR